MSAQLRTIEKKITTALGARTRNTIELGNLLLDAQRKVPFGEWLTWVQGRFPMSIRTAENYMSAAEYVKRRELKFATVANLEARLLYALAGGRCYEEEVESRILDMATRQHVTQDMASEIEDKFWAERIEPDEAPPPDTATPHLDELEAAALLDGPPPPLPPPQGSGPQMFGGDTPDVYIADFDAALKTINRVRTRLKPADAAAQVYRDQVERAAEFLAAVLTADAAATQEAA